MEPLAVCTCKELLKGIKKPESVESKINDLKHFPRTWHADEPRRHWEMMLHCDQAIFPRPTPNLPLLTRQTRFYWQLYSATAKHQNPYQKNLNSAILLALSRMIRMKKMSTDVLFSEQLIRMQSFDEHSRRLLVNRLEQYLHQQSVISTFCMEGLQLKREEGLRLILALFKSRKRVKRLYCWRAFRRTEGPLLVDTGHLQGSGLYKDRVPRKCDWFRALACFEALTTLSLNYAYIATADGDLLIALSKKIGQNWHWLQLLCLEEETPIIVDPNDGIGGYAIPDIAWREARLWAPSLKVQFVFVGIPEYDRHKKFLTKHSPVHTFILSTDIDVRFRQPWFLDCTVKTLWMWYPKTLVYLHLQLWHQREILDPQLEKLFPTLPNLKVFEFIGEIRNIRTLCAMCCHIRARRCKVNHLNLQLQGPIDIKMNREKWTRDIECLISSFKQDFNEMGVRLEISLYPF